MYQWLDKIEKTKERKQIPLLSFFNATMAYNNRLFEKDFS